MEPSYALLSVTDKRGIEDFARELVGLGWKIISTGNTANKIAEAGVPVTDIAEWVGGDATKGHLVVSLARQTYTAILSSDIDEIEAMGIHKIGLIRCDMYHLEEAIAKPDATTASVIEATDIGGPTMLRAGFKASFMSDRIVVCDFDDCDEVIQRLKSDTMTDDYRLWLAVKAEYTVADYCFTSARYHGKGLYDGMLGRRVAECKYGENAWQTPAALYTTDSDDPLAVDKFQLVAGTPPSYNNYCDIDRMLQTMSHIAVAFDRNCPRVPFIGIAVKHGNPCGAAISGSPPEVIQKMVIGDKRAIFGGFVMVNFGIDEALAELLLTYESEGRRILDGIVAPAFTDEAVAMLKRKGDKCRLLVPGQFEALYRVEQYGLDPTRRLRQVRGGFLAQPNYTFVPNMNKVVCESAILLVTIQQLLLAWGIGSTSNSNTVTLVKDGMLIGNGVGQQDRVSCCKLAIARARDAGHDTTGAVAYSDSFFPFPDGPETLAKAGIKAILASSGSVKDAEVKKFCRDNGIILVLYPDAEARGFFGH